MTALLPCPFCGTPPAIEYQYDGPMSPVDYVECPRCHARGPAVYLERAGTDEGGRRAAEGWNTRGDNGVQRFSAEELPAYVNGGKL